MLSSAVSSFSLFLSTLILEKWQPTVCFSQGQSPLPPRPLPFVFTPTWCFTTASLAFCYCTRFPAQSFPPHGLLLNRDVWVDFSCSHSLNPVFDGSIRCADDTLFSSRAKMGKSKTTKFKRPQFNSVGLPVSATKEENVEEEALGHDSCPAAEFLEKVRHFISIQALGISMTYMCSSCILSWGYR